MEILEKQNHQLQKALHSKEQEMIRMKMRLQKCEARRRSDKAVIAKLQTRLKSKAATTKRRREARGARNKKGGLQQEAGRSDEGRDAAGGEEEGENAEAAATSSICSSSSTARGRWTDDARTRHKAEQDTDQRLRQDIYYAEMMFG